MPCAVSYRIVDSTGDPIPNAIFFLQSFQPIGATASATVFGIAEKVQADGSGEGTIDLLPGRYTGAAGIGTILQGTKDRRFEFRVPPDQAAADLQDLIDAPSIEPGEVLTPAAWGAAIGGADYYSSVATGLAATPAGDYFGVVVQQQGPQIALWRNVAGEAVLVALQIQVVA